MSAATDQDQNGWYYLDAERKSQGPFPLPYLQELNKAGYFHENTLFYIDGQGDWKKLADIPTLAEALKQPPPVKKSQPIVAAAAAPSVIKTSADPLENFLSEIKTIEAEHEDTPESPDEKRFVDDDGTVYEWNGEQRKFFPVGEGLAAPPMAEFTEEDMVFNPDEDEKQPQYQPPPKNDSESEKEEENKEKEDEESEENKKKRSAREAALEAAKERAKRAKEEAKGWNELRKNTSVYITGLPGDATIEEVAEIFGKCGIIKEDPETRQPRIKLYKDTQSGMLKGDGLVTFLKEPSVELALNLLDQTPFRFGLKPMSVQHAKFEQKGNTYVEKESAAQKKNKKKLLEIQEKRALNWGGWDDKLPATEVTVILKNMFSLEDMTSNRAAKTELEQDVMVEAKKAGPVAKVRVFAGNPAGVVSVRFKTKEAAAACLQMMQGRWFGGRQIAAGMWDGVTNYNMKLKESEEEQLKRLAKFSAEIEGDKEGEEGRE